MASFLSTPTWYEKSIPTVPVFDEQYDSWVPKSLAPETVDRKESILSNGEILRHT